MELLVSFWIIQILISEMTFAGYLGESLTFLFYSLGKVWTFLFLLLVPKGIGWGVSPSPELHYFSTTFSYLLLDFWVFLEFYPSTLAWFKLSFSLMSSQVVGLQAPPRKTIFQSQGIIFLNGALSKVFTLAEVKYHHKRTNQQSNPASFFQVPFLSLSFEPDLNENHV